MSPAEPTVVRRARVDDVEALAALAAVTFPLACPPGSAEADQQLFVAAHLSAPRFAGYLADPARDLLVAQDGATALVGYVMLVAGEPADADAAAAVRLRPTVELSKCYVHPDRHGSGTAALLMDAAVSVARDRGAAGLWLGVNQLNARAHRFYARSGFAVVGTKHFVVGTATEDDDVMERPVG